MSDPLFRYETGGPKGPHAHPIEHAHAALARFLNEDVASVGYADVLLTFIEEVRRTGQERVSTGNAYAARIGPMHVAIRHLHIASAQEASTPLDLFERAITGWRDVLAGS